MNKKMFARLASAVLTAALLLPCLAAAPVSSKGDYEVVYFWSAAEHSRAENAQIMKNNSVPRKNYVYDPTLSLTSKSNYDYNATINTEDGTRTTKMFAIRQTGDADGGLPMASTGTQMKTVEPPTIWMTEIANNPIIPKLYETLTLTHVLGVRPETISEISMLRDDDALWTVTTNKGQSWTVGMRNWTLLGSGLLNTYPGIFYQITSEPLVPDHIVLAQGERINGITYKPFGENTACTRGGFFIFTDMEIRGYRSREAYERDFPQSRTFTPVPEEDLRQIVVDAAFEMRNTEWMSTARLRTENAAGQSGISTSVRSRTVPAWTPIHGPIYQRSVCQSTEGWQAFINEDGIWTGGYTPETATGLDCATFVYNAISRVSQTNANTNMLYERDNNLYRLGDVKSADDHPRVSDVDVVNVNDVETMYESYALLRKGDAVNRMRDDGSAIHARLVRDDAVVVRNPDGSIDPDKSYVPFIEQTSTATWYIRLADGTETTIMTNDWQAAFSMVDANPGAKLLFGTFTPVAETTFRNLYSSGYVAYSLVEYRDAEVKNANAQFTIVPNDFEDISKGVAVTAASYFRLLDINLKVEDRNQGVVLYEYTEYGERGRYEHQIVNTEGLNKLLGELPAGDYRLTVSASTGPVTSVGGEDPVASRIYDFSVTARNTDDRQAKLVTDKQKVTAGEEFHVDVELVSAFDAADVEVKYDTEAMSFVSGEIVLDPIFEEVTDNDGIVRMTCVDANGSKQLARLTFKAKADMAKLSDHISIKSVMTTNASLAVTNNMTRGHYATGTCASLGMADVYENAWYHEAVDYAVENGLMSGYGTGKFGPNDTLSRAMVVQILYNNEGKPALAGNRSFPDVKGGDWFNGAVSWAAANKLVDGYGDGRFGPNDAVTLEQIAVILWNYAGSPVGKGSAAALGAHSDWAANALSWAEGIDLFKNVNGEAVTAAATRAQTAQLLMNYLER